MGGALVLLMCSLLGVECCRLGCWLLLVVVFLEVRWILQAVACCWFVLGSAGRAITLVVVC